MKVSVTQPFLRCNALTGFLCMLAVRNLHVFSHGSLGMHWQSMLRQSSSTLWTYGHAACAALLNLGCVVVPVAQQT